MSSLPVRTVWPSGLKATASPYPRAASGEPTGEPSTAFQSRAVVSSLPVTINRPSGLNATAWTQSACWSGAAQRARRVAAFHSRAVLSPLPVGDKRRLWG